MVREGGGKGIRGGVHEGNIGKGASVERAGG